MAMGPPFLSGSPLSLPLGLLTLLGGMLGLFLSLIPNISQLALTRGISFSLGCSVSTKTFGLTLDGGCPLFFIY